MMAAAHGRSTIGIPKSVGQEFARADTGKTFDGAPLHGAGILFVAPDGRALFLRRGDKKADHEGEWDLPGGGRDGEETAEACAKRETLEEIGALPYGERTLFAKHVRKDGFTFDTFIQPIVRTFTPRLSHEHDAYVWAPLSKPPEPLHPGVEDALSQLHKIAKDDFSEAKIVRVPAGQKGGGEFAAGVGGAETAKPQRTVGLTDAPADRAKWPEHLKALKVPPAWTDLKVNADPKADLLVVGKDAKGRRQAIYSAEFTKGQAAQKFARLQELDKKFSTISAQNKKNQASKNEETREIADCMALIIEMGVRPGSEADRGGDKKAFGATTLLGKHVAVVRGKTRLRFVGKRGVKLDLPVTDATLAAMLHRRAMEAGPSGQLFPGVSEGGLLKYVKSFDGGGFKTKDFRTLLATRTALERVAAVKAPTNEKEYKKAVKAVATAVAEKLGNTPVIALQSYINPVVFAEWRAQAEKGGTGSAKLDHMQAMMKRIAEPDGGFTYQPVSDKEPKAGFALSVYPDRSFAKPVNELKFADLAKYAKANKDLFAKGDHYISAWHDPQSHQVFFDVSIVSDDDKQAAKLALEHDQIAYFDLAKGKSVTVNAKATSGGAAKKEIARAA